MNAISRFAPAASRILLGLIFFVMGLNGFLQFLPQPPPPEKAMAFMGALAASGYMFPLIMSVQVIGGAKPTTVEDHVAATRAKFDTNGPFGITDARLAAA